MQNDSPPPPKKNTPHVVAHLKNDSLRPPSPRQLYAEILAKKSNFGRSHSYKSERCYIHPRRRKFLGELRRVPDQPPPPFHGSRRRSKKEIEPRDIKIAANATPYSARVPSTLPSSPSLDLRFMDSPPPPYGCATPLRSEKRARGEKWGAGSCPRSESSLFSGPRGAAAYINSAMLVS